MHLHLPSLAAGILVPLAVGVLLGGLYYIGVHVRHWVITNKIEADIKVAALAARVRARLLTEEADAMKPVESPPSTPSTKT